jgi:hypothetical protein
VGQGAHSLGGGMTPTPSRNFPPAAPRAVAIFRPAPEKFLGSQQSRTEDFSRWGPPRGIILPWPERSFLLLPAQRGRQSWARPVGGAGSPGGFAAGRMPRGSSCGQGWPPSGRNREEGRGGFGGRGDSSPPEIIRRLDRRTLSHGRDDLVLVKGAGTLGRKAESRRD